MNLKRNLHNITKYVDAKSPKILKGLGLAGFGATVYFTATSTVDAVRVSDQIDADNPEMDEKDIRKLKVKKIAPLYIKPALTGATSVACILVGDHIQDRRSEAAIAGAIESCRISRDILENYKDAVREELGDEKYEKVQAKADEKNLRKNPPTEEDLRDPYTGDVLFHDSLSGRYFWSTVEKVRAAEIIIKERMPQEMWCSLNDLYYELDNPKLPPIALGDTCGWGTDHPLEIVLRPILDDTNRVIMNMEADIWQRFEVTGDGWGY